MYIFANSKCVCMIKTLRKVRDIVVMSLILMILPSVANAEAWIDSLYVRIAEPAMDRTGGGAVLTFDIEIYRPVEKWNNDDYTLGRCDFVFGKPGLMMGEIFSDVSVTSLQPEISLGMTAALQLDASFPLNGQSLSVSLAPSVSSASPLMVPYKEWMKLCKVKLILANPTTVELGLLWDRKSTGCITSKYVVICETLMGDLDKIPDKLLTFSDYSKSQTVCSGEDVMIYAKAVSSEDGLTCSWKTIVDGAWKTVTPTTAGQAGQESSWATGDGFSYQMKGALKDTLILRGLTFDPNAHYFKCVAKIPTGTTESENTRETPDIKLTVLPEVKVALEGYPSLTSFKKNLESPADTIYRCEGNAVTAKPTFYVNSAEALSAMKNMGGKVYVEYKWLDELGGTGEATLEVPLSDIGNSVTTPSGIGAVTSDKLALNLTENGKYYIKKVWTDSCAVGKVLTEYDTVIVKTQGNVSYEFDPITYVAGSPAVDLNVEGFTFTDVTLKSPSIGSIFADAYSCTAGKVGTDTLIYTYENGSCTLNATRLVKVVYNKSVAIKVLLEGPYIAKADSMRCVYQGYFPGTETEYQSPYADNLTCPKPFPAFDRKICDWVFIEIWDNPPHGTTYSSPDKGKLVASSSALLLSNGTVAGLDGKKYVSFNGLTDNEYYVVVKHRNHMSVMSAQKVKFASGTAPGPDNTIDFTVQAENAFDIEHTSSTQSPLFSNNGRLLMYASEIVEDGKIGPADYKVVFGSTNSSELYNDGDLDFDSKPGGPADVKMCFKNMNIYIKY